GRPTCAARAPSGPRAITRFRSRWLRAIRSPERPVLLTRQRRRGRSTCIMAKGPSSADEVFLSGPFEPDEVERLLGLIDERLRLRVSHAPPVASERRSGARGEARAASEPALFDPLATVTGDGLRALAAPLFNQARGGPLGRSARRLRNLPLRLFGKPQADFNYLLRSLAFALSDLLRGVVDGQELLQ